MMVSAMLAQQAQWAELAANGVRYCFVITAHRDFDTDRMVKVPAGEREYGPRNATPDQVRHAERHGQPWRLLDDDGILYTRGVMWASDAPEDWTQSDACFAPLDDYGRPAQGATELQYRKDGHWRGL